jgi:hypothetical protein
MSVPAIIWRNPKTKSKKRLWSEARRNGKRSVYVVMRSGPKKDEWEGLPNLEVIYGKAPVATRQAKNERTLA